MRHEHRKVSRIADELITFFLEHHAKEIKLNVKDLQDREVITIKASPVDHLNEVIEDLEKVLSYPRESEMEEYFWELAGECDYSSELALVGSMIDRANIDYEEDYICLELIRKKKD